MAHKDLLLKPPNSYLGSKSLEVAWVMCRSRNKSIINIDCLGGAELQLVFVLRVPLRVSAVAGVVAARKRVTYIDGHLAKGLFGHYKPLLGKHLLHNTSRSSVRRVLLGPLFCWRGDAPARP